MSGPDDLPKWAQDRLEAEERMGGSFEGSPAERIGFSIGIMLALMLAAVRWLAFLAVCIAVLYLVGKAMGWS